MPQRGQTTALSSSASSSAPAATGPDGGWSAEPQPTAAVCTDESSGGDFEAQSREAVQPQAQQPLLMQWLASADSATQRHAAGVMAAVNVATAISLMCSHPALTSLAWRAPPQAAAVRTSEAAPGGSNLGSTPATTQAPSQTALPPLGPATEHRKRPSGATDAASRSPVAKRRSLDLGSRPR
ncbi:hypothetical protein COHA_008726 [Chlorella ohadii]|uniref:Uncharacterized protein n=1 Tax=Chlorella ohadii TaxID=2649997 RepID=A0AAD5H1B9_9CHLO|nr:hypothetical protein COHA_008726 [Chlorella ohadii]